MTDTWLKAISDGRMVGCVMVDFRKAFGLVDHGLSLQGLYSYKFSQTSLFWFTSYNSNITQQVVINEVNSDKDDVECGVPQGSIRVPLLFLSFSNDLPLSLKNSISSVDLYADDTTIYDKKALKLNIQNALALIHN